MEAVLLIVGGIVGIGGGIGIGLLVGGKLRDRKSWMYWTANGVAVLLGLVVMFLGLQMGQNGLYVAGIGLLGGGVTGLKYGYGRSVGIWRVHDRALGNDKDMLD